MKKLNLFDLIIATLLLLVMIFAITFYIKRPDNLNDNVQLRLKVTSSTDILTEAKKQKKVYFNNLNQAVDVVSVEEIKGEMFITLQAKGTVEPDRYIFNGQRVLIGRKAEIHSTYFAQGLIFDVKEVN